MRTSEIRITSRTGSSYGAGAGDGELEAAALERGRALLREAAQTYGFQRRDRFTATRSRFGVLISGVRLAAPQCASDELAEARLELLAERARLIPGGPR